MTRDKLFHAIMKDDKFWGIQYSDGKTTEHGWGPIENAMAVDPRYCKTPTDATYKGSPNEKQLREGRIVTVKQTIITTIKG